MNTNEHNFAIVSVYVHMYSQIPGLVENNWNLAVECLLRLQGSDLISPEGRSPGKQVASSSTQRCTAAGGTRFASFYIL